jgi:hypothetical protein
MQWYILAKNRESASAYCKWLHIQGEQVNNIKYCGSPDSLLGINHCTVIILDCFLEHRQASAIFEMVMTASMMPDVRVQANLCTLHKLMNQLQPMRIEKV